VFDNSFVKKEFSLQFNMIFYMIIYTCNSWLAQAQPETPGIFASEEAAQIWNKHL